MHSQLVAITCSIVLLVVTGCSSMIPSFYKVDVKQGNYIDKAMMDELKPGMTKTQVQFLLGTPMLQDPFHANRWDYIYRIQKGNGDIEQRHMALYFEGDLLSRIAENADIP